MISYLNEESASENDLKDDRIFKVNTENHIHVTRKSLYDMWFIHFEHGTVPKELDGAWTSFQEARAKIEKYCRDKKIDIEEVIL